jgi:phosphate transport system substrate-binding protein
MTHRHRHPSSLAAYLGLLATTTLAAATPAQGNLSPWMGNPVWATKVPEFTPATASSPAANPGSTPATPAQPVSPLADPNRDFPWWPWLVAFPVLGTWLWWMLRQGAPTEQLEASSDPAAAPAPSIAAPSAEATTQTPRIILTPYSCTLAYAYWELPPSEVDALHPSNGRLTLRLHDVTDQPPRDSLPESAQRWACDRVAVGDRHLPIPQASRDYIIELGYGDETGIWHTLVQSAPVRVLAPNQCPADGDEEPRALDHPAMPLDSEMASPAADPIRPQVSASLVAQDGRTALATWDLLPEQASSLATAHGSLTVRLYDVTEMPGSFALGPNPMQAFEAEPVPQASLTIPIAVDDRDYLIEVGYLTEDGQWFVFAKSSPVRVPAC